LILLILSFSPVTAVHASDTDTVILLASYGSILGETVITHYLSIGVDNESVDTIEPLLAAFANHLYGLETEFGKVTVRYEGTFDDIDLSDFTDIALAWNGEPLEFTFSSTRKIKHGYRQDFVTDIYLDITVDYEKPGVYSFTGMYKGVTFTLCVEVEIGRVANIPADPAKLKHLSVTYLPAGEIQTRPVTDISFHFNGIHERFSVNDLRDVRLTNGGTNVTFTIHDYIVRHFVYNEDGNAIETVFTLVFVNPLTTPGIYRLSGFYRNEPFSLSWMQWN